MREGIPLRNCLRGCLLYVSDVELWKYCQKATFELCCSLVHVETLYPMSVAFSLGDVILAYPLGQVKTRKPEDRQVLRSSCLSHLRPRQSAGNCSIKSRPSTSQAAFAIAYSVTPLGRWWAGIPVKNLELSSAKVEKPG